MKEINTPATVYVIDDDTALRTAYTAALSGLGYEVKSAIDGQEGQKLIADKKPDLIVLDMLMPNLDGMSFLKQLRKDEDYDQVKVFVVSNFEALPEAEELGVVKYMSKMQHGPDEVAAAVDNILKTA
jgi:CheY-like chemotaxis protein